MRISDWSSDVCSSDLCAIERVEIVVMTAQRHEIFGACSLVEVDQCLGLPMFGLPAIFDLDEAGIRRMPVMREMVRVHRVALDVHQPPVPVARLGHALRAPVRPDPQPGTYGTPSCREQGCHDWSIS